MKLTASVSVARLKAFVPTRGHPSASAHLTSTARPGRSTSDLTRVRSRPGTRSCAARHPLHTMAKTKRQLPRRLRLASRLAMPAGCQPQSRSCAAHAASFCATSVSATFSSTSIGRPPAQSRQPSWRPRSAAAGGRRRRGRRASSWELIVEHRKAAAARSAGTRETRTWGEAGLAAVAARRAHGRGACGRRTSAYLGAPPPAALPRAVGAVPGVLSGNESSCNS